MNEKSDREPDAADQSQATDASQEMKLFETSLTVAELDLHGGVFWDEMTRCTDEVRLEDLVDAVLSRQPSSRIWVVLDTPSNTAARSVAALIVARTLCRRGKKVLLLDGDDLRPDLTRWAGSFEKEGWIDYLRYGASLTACAVPFPWEGGPGYFVGVGSFCPTQVTVEEVKQLLGRLRPQADDIVITAPLSDVGRQWAQEASVRLLCWDRQAHSRTASEAKAAGLAAAGMPVAGLVGFGVTADEMQAVGPTEPANDEPARIADEDSAAELAERFVIVSREEKLQTKSSRFFWGLAAMLAVLVVVIGVIWFRISQFRTGDSEVQNPPATVAADLGGAAPDASGLAPQPVSDETGSAERSAVARDEGKTAANEPEPPAAGDPGAIEPASAKPIAAKPTVAGQERPDDREAASGDQTQASGGPAAQGGAPADQGGDLTVTSGSPIEESGGPTETDRVPVGEAVPFDFTAYRVPVGQAGWALHLYSLADSSAARRQMEELDRLGIRAAERLVVLPEKGRWHRVYVGSFSSRQEANAAKPLLLEKLGEDYAMPYRFR